MKQTVLSEPVNRSFGLDLARAIAISLVLIAHFAKKFEHFGFWGVELFFGLSGFLIGQILWRSYSETPNWSFKHMLNFWARRWWRTLPNYYLFLIVMLFFHYGSEGFPSIYLFLKHLWFGQNFTSRDGSFFGVAWSLCIEEWFYLIFPSILFVFSRFKINAKVAFTLSLITIFLFCAIVREILIADNVGHSLRGITLARLDAIGCGVLVAFWFSIVRFKLMTKWITFFVGVTLFLISYYTVYQSGLSYDEIKESRYLLVIVSLGFSLMLPALTLMRRPVGIFRTFSIVTEKMSFWSYSLYLSHIPVMFTVYRLMDSFRDENFINLLSKVIGLIITIGISALIFTYFELPLTKKRPKEIN